MSRASAVCGRPGSGDGEGAGGRCRGLRAGVSDAVEPERGQAGAAEDEEQRRRGEPLRDLLLLLGVADLGAEALVDLGEVLGRRRLEVATAGRLRDGGERLGVRRHVERAHLAGVRVLDVDRAVLRAERDGVDGHVGRRRLRCGVEGLGGAGELAPSDSSTVATSGGCAGSAVGEVEGAGDAEGAGVAVPVEAVRASAVAWSDTTIASPSAVPPSPAGSRGPAGAGRGRRSGDDQPRVRRERDEARRGRWTKN